MKPGATTPSDTIPTESEGVSSLLVRLSKLSVAIAIVKKAQVAADTLLTDTTLDPNLGRCLARSKGMFIAPDIRPEALVLSSACSGMFMARPPGSEDWNGPTFHVLGGLSSALKLPGPSAAIFLLAMTDRGVNAFLSRSIQLGNETRIAAAGRADDDADILSFAFPGGARSTPPLEHAIITACEGLNQTIYGGGVTPADIITRGTPPGSSDAGLGRTLIRLARRSRETQRRRGSFLSPRPAPAPATLR